MIIKFDPVPYFCDYANAEVTPKMGSYSDGAYVFATDYAALEARIANLDQKFMILQGSHDLLLKERDEWKRRCENIVTALGAKGFSAEFLARIAEGRDNG